MSPYKELFGIEAFEAWEWYIWPVLMKSQSVSAAPCSVAPITAESGTDL